MKNIYLTSLFSLLCIWQLSAQRIFNSFSTTLTPAGWSVLVNMGPLISQITTDPLSFSNPINAYGATGTGVLFADCFNVSSPDSAELETRTFTPTISGDSLRFDIAHATYNISNRDSLSIWVYNGTSYSLLRGWKSSLTVDTGITTAAAYASNTWIPNNSQWRTKVLALPSGTTKVKFRFHSGYGNSMYVDNILVDSYFVATQTLDSVTAIQTISNILTQGSTNQRVMQIPVKVTGQLTPLSVTTFIVSTTGTTNPLLTLDSAKIYFTGANSSFSATNKFGATANPGGSIAVNGSQVLSNGFNYFWLVYDIKQTAPIGNSVDAALTSAVIGGIARTPNTSSPAGSYTVARMYNFDTTSNQNFTTIILGGTALQQWQKGVPFIGPGSSYSLPNCWGTNLSGNYSTDAAYALLSPQFISSSSAVNLSYSEWYNMAAWDNGNFEYKINSGSWTAAGSAVNNANTAWNEKYYSLPTVINDTIQFRWRFTSVNWTTSSLPGWYIDNFAIANVSELQMSFASATIFQDSAVTAAGFINQKILRIEINTSGTANPYTLSQLNFNSSGTTSLADLTNAKVFYSGNDPKFNTSVQFGSTVISPGATFNISGSQALSGGLNYFWLTYDPAPAAIMNNVIDASCVSVTINSTTYVPGNSSPAGNRVIGNGNNFEAISNLNYTTSILGFTNMEWQRGAPVNAGPISARSGSKCWATNLYGNYTAGSDYALLSPAYRINSTTLKFSYEEYYSTDATNAFLIPQYKINSGTWVNISSYRGNSLSWNRKDFYLTTLNINDTIQFRWRFACSTYAATMSGWYIDDVAIGNVTLIDRISPDISYIQLTNTSVFTIRTLTGFATISDDIGNVDTTVANKPRIYFKKKPDSNTFGVNNSGYSGWKFVQANNLISPFNFVIDYTLLTSAPVIGDTLQYFVVAQDMSSTPNAGSNPAAGFSASTVSAITSAPSVPNYFIFTSAPLTGVYNVGTGNAYVTITQAVNDLNLRGVSGPVTFNLTDALYSSAESFPITIGNISYASQTNSITIKPTLASTAISGNSTSIIRLINANYVTLNGAVSGTNRDLTVSNTSTLGTANTILIAGAGSASGSMNDTIKNCIIKCGGNYAGNVALNIGGAAFTGGSSISVIPNTTQSVDNGNIAIINNQLCKAFIGIGLCGTPGSNANNIYVANNLFGSTTPGEYLYWSGIFISNTGNLNFTQNTIQNIITSTANPKGIFGHSGISNSSFTRNIIDSFIYTGTSGYGSMGIHVLNASSITIANNMITRMYADGWYPAGSSDAVTGLKIDGGNAYNIFYNTVNLSGSYAGYTSFPTTTSCFYASSTTTGIDLRNNIFTNSFTNTNNITSSSFAFASDAPSSSYTGINYNNYFTGGSQAVLGFANSTSQGTLAALTAAIGGNTNSKNIAVNYNSNADAHLAGSSIGNYNLKCLPVAGITNDADGQSRFASWHYMGADEIPSSPLPVVLFNFNVNRNGSNAELFWSTASEMNNGYFVIERSLNGDKFNEIEQVNGADYSNHIISYHFTDENAESVSNRKSVYYRIKQTDQTGDFSYSAIASVDFSTTKSNAPFVFPNPFEKEVNIRLYNNQSGRAELSLQDIGGRTVVNQLIQINKGEATIHLMSENSTPDPGVYILRITLDGQTTTFKLIKN